MGDLYGASPAAGRLDAATAPERILDTAARLFYTRGLRAVGVNTIIAESGTAKATFHRHFPAKDDLILAYLDRADQVWTRQLHAAAAAAGPEPGHQLAGLFDALDSVSGHGSFRGCAFINAAAEAAPETPATAGPSSTNARFWNGSPILPGAPAPTNRTALPGP